MTDLKMQFTASADAEVIKAADIAAAGGTDEPAGPSCDTGEAST